MADNRRENTEIPQAVKDEVKGLLVEKGGEVTYMGLYRDHEAYQFLFPEVQNTGYPIIILYLREADMAYKVPANDSLEVLAEVYGEE
ncbi:MAG: hypothetical protein IKN58_03490 [Prevotella sp.]|nr:hypothetical protein [Prevotella sp.]